MPNFQPKTQKPKTNTTHNNKKPKSSLRTRTRAPRVSTRKKVRTPQAHPKTARTSKTRSRARPSRSEPKRTFGQKLGGFLGAFANKSIGTYMGSGAYTDALGNELGVPSADIAFSDPLPEVNSLVQPVNSDVVSYMHANTDGTVKLVRREFVQLIEIQDGDNTYDIRIDPSRQLTFPWLHNVAKSWQQYQFTGLSVEYVPTSGFAVGDDSAALGQVAMAFRYDTTVDDSDFPTGDLVGMLNYQGSVSMSPAAPGACFMECDPTKTNQAVRFIRDADSGSINYSEQNFEAAQCLIMTSGAQNALDVQCGQVWITYEVLLYNPRSIPVTLFDWAEAVKGDDVFARYLPQLLQLDALRDHAGPYTQDEAFARDAIISVTVSRLQQPEYTQRLANLRARMRAYYAVEHSSKPSSPTLRLIHDSQIYKELVKINPPKHPIAATVPDSDQWETGSTLGGL